MKHTVKLILGACALLAHTVSGQTWASPRDSEGWTILNPSSDSRIIYVSTTDGNNSTAQNYTVAQVGSDPRHPTISVNAYATLGAALAQMRDTYPDWILLKTGDTFPEHQINLHHIGIGRSASERMVFSYYGDSSQRPVILKPDIRAWRVGKALTHNGLHFWAFVGIEFYNSSADPDSPDYISSTDRTGGSDFLAGGDNLLIEDCKFNFWGLGVQGPERPWVNLEIRRNILYKQYYYDSCVDRNRRPSAVYLHRIENYLIEENITDYGGWNPDIPGASRNAFNHGFYIQFTCEGELYFRGNIIARASGNGVQSRSGGLVEKNLVIQSPAGLFTAHDTVSGTAADPGLTAVRHNVVLEGLTMGNCPQATSANWGIPLHETLKCYRPKYHRIFDRIEVVGKWS